MSELAIPDLSLVVLIGVSGSGKSTFAKQHFGPYEVISSDYCRGLVADDENDQSATKPAFELLHYIVGKRLEAGRLTVVDATNVQPSARKSLLELARDHDVLPVAIVLDVPESVCVERNSSRPDRDFGARVVKRQHDQLRRSSGRLSREGFRVVHRLHGTEEIEAATIVREPLRSDHRHRTGPFDVIGDVHGCRSELETLLDRLGYRLLLDDHDRPIDAVPPAGRTAIFLGDLVDRGPDSPGVLRLVMGMVEAGHALAVPGNHEAKLVRALRGRKVQRSHGLAETLDQLDAETDAFRHAVLEFCDGLVAHLVLDGGRLVVAHAGLKEAYHNRASGRVRSFALYGDTTGETDAYGLPVRYPWANDYRGRAMVLYGHTPVPEPEWVNNTLCLDTGCAFGGHLTALRYPEKELVEVPAEQQWYQPAKPFPTARPRGERDPEVLELTDVTGKRVIDTADLGRVTIREENAAGALEVISRFALHPRWLRYLPPTMAPAPTSDRPGLLEHPEDAFAAYRDEGVTRLICEEKHMGSRAVLLVCRDQQAARERFGAVAGETGAIHTRTGRGFFEQAATEQLLDRIRAAADRAGLWQRLDADWLLLDAELLPWSAKAGSLITDQYARVGAAARSALPAAVAALETARQRGLDVDDLTRQTRARRDHAAAFSAAYRRYQWPTDGLTGIRIAVFQLPAAGATTYSEADHGWHLEIADELVAADPELFLGTRRIEVDGTDEQSMARATRWWEDLTAAGGEGMVVKPYANLSRGGRGLVQPGLKVRGREYLRLIYGPDYTDDDHLVRLRQRGLGHKRSLALREYALGLESLRRTAAGEPLWRVHESVFAVLALESEPIDPRL